MLKIIKEDIIDKNNNNSSDGKISNEDFFEIIERMLKIAKFLSVTNSYSINNASVIWAQTRLIRDAITEIEEILAKHIEIQEYINK